MESALAQKWKQQPAQKTCAPCCRIFILLITKALRNEPNKMQQSWRLQYVRYCQVPGQMHPDARNCPTPNNDAQPEYHYGQKFIRNPFQIIRHFPIAPYFGNQVVNNIRNRKMSKPAVASTGPIWINFCSTMLETMRHTVNSIPSNIKVTDTCFFIYLFFTWYSNNFCSLSAKATAKIYNCVQWYKNEESEIQGHSF